MSTSRRAVVWNPSEGRPYAMGPLSANFKADGDETQNRYSISEWWLEPHTAGPGAHDHEDDDVFYVLEGTVSILIGDEWIDATRGAFVLIPGGMTHNFENRSDERAGFLNVSVPGGFEANMPAIVEWFEKNPPGEA